MWSAGHDRLKRPGHNPLALALDIVPREAPGLVVRVLSRIRVLNRQGPSARSTPRTKVRKAEKVEPLRWLVVLAGNPRSYPPKRDEPRLLGRQFESELA